MNWINKIILDDDPYTRISNKTLRDTNLSYVALGILAETLSHRGDWQVTRDYLQKRRAEGRKMIQNAMSELEQHGYIQFYTEKGADGQFAVAGWIFRASPVAEEQRTNKTRWCDPEEWKKRKESLSEQSTDEAEYRQDDIVSEPDLDRHIERKSIQNKNSIKTKSSEEKKEEYVQGEILELDPSMEKKNSEDSIVEEIYNLYHRRKVKKPAALAAIKKALKKAPPELLKSKVTEFMEAMKETDTCWIPHPAKWFNEERWTEDSSQWRTSSNNRKPNGNTRKPNGAERFGERYEHVVDPETRVVSYRDRQTGKIVPKEELSYA